MKTFSIITLGCKVNQYDSEAIADALEEAGLAQVKPHMPSDLCVINTCTVTSTADQKSRQQIKRAIRAHPGAQIVATGCAADNDPERLRSLAGVDHVVSNRAKGQIPELLGLAEGTSLPGIRKFGNHTRAFLKVQDGCECFCTYCIIPYVRGKVVSRPLSQIEGEARRLVESGHKEIVLTGIHIGSYGIDFTPRRSVADILEKLVPLEGLHRIRISSIEAREFSEQLLEQIAHYPKLCPHFHIPLQSGSDKILTWMKRRYRRDDLFHSTDRLKELLEKPAFTTDVIVGFPGETQEDFEQTLEAARRIGFSKIHIFPYSDREGTPAVKLPNKVPPEVIRKRCQCLAGLEQELALAYKRKFLGKEVNVLIESARDTKTGKLAGLTPRYLRVLFDGPNNLCNEFVNVRITEVSPTAALGDAGFSSPAAPGADPLPIVERNSFTRMSPC